MSDEIEEWRKYLTGKYLTELYESYEEYQELALESIRMGCEDLRVALSALSTSNIEEIRRRSGFLGKMLNEIVSNIEEIEKEVEEEIRKEVYEKLRSTREEIEEIKKG